LEREDPDVTLSAEERGIGGLGIFLTRKTMDELNYEYRDGSNILTMKKTI
jgi:anti-sigma regulatory factor (Ser/Thr protein kinase)